MTKKQKAVLEIIKDMIKENGYSPTVREVAERGNYKSTATVHGYLKRLEESGHIRRKKESPRSIVVCEDSYVKDVGYMFYI